MKNLVVNKRASYDYAFSDFYEAGLVLLGHEVKSIKTGHVSLKGSFVTLKDNELFLTNANIPPYVHSGSVRNYDPTHPRKLLLKKSQIKSLIGKVRASGLTLVPIRLYTKKRLIKLEFAVARGKKEYDKRQDIKKREAQRKVEKMLKISN